MKVTIATTPIRPYPADFPPIGSLSIVKHLKKNGISDVEFYHIDGNRPSDDEVIAHFARTKPDVLGVSAVVSTAYAYTKKLVENVKQVSPDTLIVVGGSLAASAEVLLRKTQVDLCATGEGEVTMLKIVERAKQTRDPVDFADIPGLALIDKNGFVINTGYEDQIPADLVYDFDWEDLERATDIGIYVSPAFTGDTPAVMFREDPRSYEPERRGKNSIIIPAAKGCVAKCTFCHRFTKGIRYIPVPLIMERVRHVVSHYNVGFINFGDENFGTDKRWLAEFCREIKKFDILWRVQGMRVNCVNPEIIAMMRDAGCSSILYGMETGSAKILEIMEKKVNLEDNYNAIKWTVEAGVRTIVQLVIGMPGESPETIKETIAFAKYANTLSERQCPTELSINYAQALPGTPLYEFGRRNGLIGKDLDSEETYLLKVSDKDAHDEQNTLNFTEYPKLVAETWRQLIQIETNYAYVKKFGLTHYQDVLLRFSQHFKSKEDSGYFANPKRIVDRSATTDTVHDVHEAEVLDDKRRLPSLWSLLRQGKIGLASICYPVQFHHIRFLMLLLMVFRNLRYSGVAETKKALKEYLNWRINQRFRTHLATNGQSLRKVIRGMGPNKDDSPAMEPLRHGR